MRLRWFLGILIIYLGLIHNLNAANIRNRRETIISRGGPSSPLENKSYKPPLIQMSPISQVVPYQPPLLLASSNEYKPLISSSQTQSVRYQAPAEALPSGYGHSQGYGAPLLVSAQTNSNSLNALPSQPSNRQGFSYSGDPAPSNQFQSQPLQQAGSKPESGTVSKDGNSPLKDEYVVYYYYYYDNDNTTGSSVNKSNSSPNFDDIPSLESYDTDKTVKEPEKSASARTLAANVNSLGAQDAKKLGLNNQDSQIGSQPRSLSNFANQQPPLIKSDVRTSYSSDVYSDGQILKPVPNVYRYGTNEVPRLPVLPNFAVSEPPPVTRSVGSGPTPGSLRNPSDNPTTQSSISGSGPQLPGDSDHESDDINVVLDQPVESKSDDDKTDKILIEDATITTTTTEATTTTEDPTTTTTEKSRRRAGAGNRRRFNPSPASFSSNRRQGATRSSTSTTTSTTTIAPGSSSTRSSFRGSNRVRPRPTISSSRPRPSFSRNAPSTNDNEDLTKPVDSASNSTTIKPKFGATGSRRFSSTRTRSQVGSTTRSPSSTSSSISRSAVTPSRPRPPVRPRPNNFVSRSRGPRPGFLRPKPGSEPEELETTTTTPLKVEDEISSSPSSSSVNESSLANNEKDIDEDSDEDEETSETETEEPTTTEKNRFSALFRPRNRNTLNRPRPVVSDRPRRS